MHPTPQDDARAATELARRMLRQVFEHAHDPFQINKPFAYLLTNDGAVLVTKGNSGFLQWHALEQAEGCHWDIGELPIALPKEYGPQSTSAIVCTKRIALGLRDIGTFLLK